MSAFVNRCRHLQRIENLALNTATEMERFGYSTAAIVVLTQLRRERADDSVVIARHQLEISYAKAVLLEQQNRTDDAFDRRDFHTRSIARSSWSAHVAREYFR